MYIDPNSGGALFRALAGGWAIICCAPVLLVAGAYLAFTARGRAVVAGWRQRLRSGKDQAQE